jgi:hypothetical protein
MNTLNEHICMFMTAFRSVYLRMRDLSDKFVEKIKIVYACLMTFLRKSCLLSDNVEKCGSYK